MGTPEEDFETATKKSVSRESREDAIHELALANECDKLAILVQMSGLDANYRRAALNGLMKAPCDPILQSLAEDGSLDNTLREEAQNYLQNQEKS